MKKYQVLVSVVVLALGTLAVVVAQPPPRMHNIVKKGELQRRPATSTPSITNEVAITIEGDDRVIRSWASTSRTPMCNQPGSITTMVCQLD